MRNLNHEFLHLILYELEGCEVATMFDNFKTPDNKIKDIVVGAI